LHSLDQRATDLTESQARGKLSIFNDL